VNTKSKAVKANLMVLNRDSQEVSPGFDRIKWTAAVIILLVSLVGNYYYSALSWPLRLLGWLLVLAIVTTILSFTVKGKQAIEFIRESRLELRKVVWPTRQETIQTTLVVGAMVIVLALVLWGMDGILVWLIGWLTGQRG